MGVAARYFRGAYFLAGLRQLGVQFIALGARHVQRGLRGLQFCGRFVELLIGNGFLLIQLVHTPERRLREAKIRAGRSDCTVSFRNRVAHFVACRGGAIGTGIHIARIQRH